MIDLRMEKNNRGFSLVELIVAVSIATIVSAAIGALMVTSIRTYSNQNVLTGIQKEIQTTLNQVVDSAESACWFYLDNDYSGADPVKTNCVAFGRIAQDESDSEWYFVGEIFAAGDEDPETNRFNIYMNRYALGGSLQLSGANKAERVASAVSLLAAEKSTILGDSDNRKYLIGEDATAFLVKINNGNIDSTTKSYVNPLSFDIGIKYQKTGFGARNLEREIHDQAMLRNSLNYNIVIGSDTYELKE